MTTTKLQRLEQIMLDASRNVDDAQRIYKDAKRAYHEEEQRLMKRRSRRTTKKSTHGHRWQEVADAPGARSYETCSVKGCKARRSVPDCRQAGAPSDVEKTCRCPDCVKARSSEK